MITTLCISCNRPAPEFDQYQELAAHLMSQIASGVTIIRQISQGVDAHKKSAIGRAADWVEHAEKLIHEATDYREMVSEVGSSSIHSGCDSWKQTHRRVNSLAIDLDFMRRDLIGHFVPGFKG